MNSSDMPGKREIAHGITLLAGQQLGISDDVDEEDMSDFQAQFRLFLFGHRR
jgi:hypothetical protein